MCRFVVCVLWFILSLVAAQRSREEIYMPPSSRVLLEKYFWRNYTTPVETTSTAPIEPTTFKYPTATWSASAYQEKKMKTMMMEAAKLYLFKPSPFLKPPFTEGEEIIGIEDGVNVHGKRRGKVRWRPESKEVFANRRDDNSYEQKGMLLAEETRNDFLDQFLQQSLAKYLTSANLTDMFGHITVEEFAEALKKVTQDKKKEMYDHNKELRKKFREEALKPKKSESKPGLLERQYQRRLQKTWEILNENISVPSRSAFLDQRETWSNSVEDSIAKITLTTSEPERPSYFDQAEGWIDSVEKTTPRMPTTTTRPTIQFSRTPMMYTTTSSLEHLDAYHPTSPVTTSIPSSLAPTKPAPKVKSKTARGSKKYRDHMKNKLSEHWDKGEIQLSVAETVYYRPRQNQLHSYTFKDMYGSIPGEPEKDYPMLSSAPTTGFKCPKTTGDKTPKMMADPKTRCQVFYICSGDGPATPMLCPNGTMFNENVLVCDWWYNVDC